MALKDWLQNKKQELETSKQQKLDLNEIRQQAKRDALLEAEKQKKELYMQQKANVYEQEKNKILQEQLAKQQALDTRSGKERFVEGVKNVGQKLSQASQKVGSTIQKEGKQLGKDVTQLNPSKVTQAFNPVRRESYQFNDKLFQNKQQVNPQHLQGKGLDISKINQGMNKNINEIISDKTMFNTGTGSFNNEKLNRFFLK